MSIRAFGARLFRHGHAYIKHFCKRELHGDTIIAETINAAQVGGGGAARGSALRNVGAQVGLHARRIFIDNVLSRVTNSLAGELRKKAAKRILFGDSGPFFALVGVSLASGTGILTKEEELEGVCWEIREAISKIKWNYHESADIEAERFENDQISTKDLIFSQPIAKGSNAVVYAAKINEQESSGCENDDSVLKYPLAVKMMFNYDIQSNGMAILKAMYKETIPARVYYSHVGIADWELDLTNRKRHLPPHPNIVAMYSVFTDYIPELQQAKHLYPAALPRRIDPEGEGRNMSLFLIMKRYNCTLHEYLTSTALSRSLRTSILLFSQLLEGIAHLTAHGIAHRDLKSDNLLLDLSESHAPVLVVSDFGCCLADKSQNLSVSYTSEEMDKGGNAALMAPEIRNQTPGTFSVLNYSRSDLWAAASIAYEIFGLDNPFYVNGSGVKLRNVDYREEDLPELREEVPQVFKALIGNLLKRNPNRRLDPEVAANVCQLFLWAPSSWLQPGLLKLPTSAEILQWLLCLTTKVLCEGRLNNTPSGKQQDEEASFVRTGGQKAGRRTYTEYLLISSFLVRARLSNIKAALTWIHNNI